jgi:H+/gluconate symporter-like permease
VKSREDAIADVKKVYYPLLVSAELGKLEFSNDAKIGVSITAVNPAGGSGRVICQMNGAEFLADLGTIVHADPHFDAAAVAARVAKHGSASVVAMISLGILVSVISEEIEKEIAGPTVMAAAKRIDESKETV